MVLKPFDPIVGKVVRDTPGERGAVLMSAGTEWHQGGTHAEFGGDFWIPKSVLHEDSLDTIEEAVEGEEIEIYVARWWLEDKT